MGHTGSLSNKIGQISGKGLILNLISNWWLYIYIFCRISCPIPFIRPNTGYLVIDIMKPWYPDLSLILCLQETRLLIEEMCEPLLTQDLLYQDDDSDDEDGDNDDEDGDNDDEDGDSDKERLDLLDDLLKATVDSDSMLLPVNQNNAEKNRPDTLNIQNISN